MVDFHLLLLAGVTGASLLLAHLLRSDRGKNRVRLRSYIARAGQPNVRAMHGDGTRIDFDPADVKRRRDAACRSLARQAQGSRPDDPRADQGKDAGGAWFRIERGFSPSGFTRPISSRARARATLNPSRVTRLYRRGDVPEERCWLRRPDWCLAYE